MRYGAVITADTHTDCLAQAQRCAAQPQMSITPAPVKLVVRKVDERWEAAWETKEAGS